MTDLDHKDEKDIILYPTDQTIVINAIFPKFGEGAFQGFSPRAWGGQFKEAVYKNPDPLFYRPV